MSPNIHFDFGDFVYEKIESNSVRLIRGKFNISYEPKFPKEFEKSFWFYDLDYENNEDSRKNVLQVSLGPYYPKWKYSQDCLINHDIEYPAFSDILLSSKSGPLHRAPSDFIITARKEQLKIFSNFSVYYIKNFYNFLDCDLIIPVPAKQEYTFNSVEIICREFGENLKIPIKNDLIERDPDKEKSYKTIDGQYDLSQSRLLIIDDIITDGDTRDIICYQLRSLGCQNLCFVTLGQTDHNTYEYFD